LTEKFVHFSDIEKTEVVWYRNVTIFSDTLYSVDSYGSWQIAKEIPETKGAQKGRAFYMKDFMTRVSDYWNERWNDPANRESRLGMVLIGAVAVVIIVILLLLLWRYALVEKEKRETAKQGETAQEAATHEEQTIVYMADPEEQEAMRQEYLTSIQYLDEQVEKLLQNMTQVEESLSESVQQCEQTDIDLSERINEFYQTVSNTVQELQETQVKLYDLTDIVQILDGEKLPIIQEQVGELQQDIGKVQTDIADVYIRIDDLKEADEKLTEEDEKLWAKIENVKSSLEQALNENIAEMSSQIDELAAKTGEQMEELQARMASQKEELQSNMDHQKNELQTNMDSQKTELESKISDLLTQLTTEQTRINGLVGGTLTYRYDKATNTLYLSPYIE
jgi:hypothetical protein